MLIVMYLTGVFVSVLWVINSVIGMVRDKDGLDDLDIWLGALIVIFAWPVALVLILVHTVFCERSNSNEEES